MKYACKNCNHHVEYTELEQHAETHNKTQAEPQTVKEMFEEVKHKCPKCHQEKAVIRGATFICQCCSHRSKFYVAI